MWCSQTPRHGGGGFCLGGCFGLWRRRWRASFCAGGWSGNRTQTRSRPSFRESLRGRGWVNCGERGSSVPYAVLAELWLAQLQVARATSAATFLVEPGLAPLIFWPLSSAALIASFISEQNNFLQHNCKTRAGETLIIVWDSGIKHEQSLMQLLGIFPSYSLSLILL